ncbi:DapH/DapD/GlmU-related protein [uncultured Alistipes sp.]|uniref:DapH/DapD/GlmU-related protein n=1 Tax=uncultured Alistipes sp. TaxID=538949 RepID=UPI00261E2801|nr:DapH/DapD/GlmU-related protein [uncultured Alistipes sp.]
MITTIGKLLYKLESYKLRFINRYKLSRLGSHGANCHIEGIINMSLSNVYIGNNVFIPTGATFLSSEARIIIGNNVMFGPNVMIATGNHRIDVIDKYMIDVKEKREKDDEDVIIENDVWIGMNAMILKGVHIGEGSVIGAGAIVTKDIPPYSIVTSAGGIRIRPRFTEEDITKHKKIMSHNE